MNCSRREFLKVAGFGTATVVFFPRLAFAAQNEIISIRTGLQPGNKTRLVIETKQKPSYSLSYPNKQIVVSIPARNTAKPKMATGTLVSNIKSSKGKIIVNLKKDISPIPKNQIMVLSPASGNKYRLVLDFAAGKATDKVRATATAAVSSKQINRKPLIVIDPGHGGKDPGCIGVTGTQEKDIVLSVAKRLANKLNASGYNAYLTRRNDTFLNLGTRAGIGEKKKADLFISIHANSNPKRSTRGFSVYTLSKKASDAEAQKLADAENAADLIEVDGFDEFEPSLRNALSSLQQHMVAENSVELAQCVINATKKYGIIQVDKGRKFGRSAPFAVLKSTTPSCLIELGHLSNREEERLLRRSDYQDKLVNAFIHAIGNYDFEA